MGKDPTSHSYCNTKHEIEKYVDITTFCIVCNWIEIGLYMLLIITLHHLFHRISNSFYILIIPTISYIKISNYHYFILDILNHLNYDWLPIHFLYNYFRISKNMITYHLYSRESFLKSHIEYVNPYRPNCKYGKIARLEKSFKNHCSGISNF